MSTALTPFVFDDLPVRSLKRDGEPWFVAADVCRILGIKNVGDATARLDDDEKDTLDNTDGIAAPQVQQFTIINESGLYSLILRSRKPSAKQFKKWITSEVIPEIRKTGSYRADPAAHARTSQAAIDLLQDLAAARQRLVDTQSRLFDELQARQASEVRIMLIKQLIRHSGLSDAQIAAEAGEQTAYVAYIRQTQQAS